MSKVTQPLKWHGGKYYLRTWLHSIAAGLNYKHRVYAFGGGMAEAWDWLPIVGVSEVYNDVDKRLTNFFRTLQSEHHFKRFCRQVETVPFSEAEWQYHCTRQQLILDDPSVDLAVSFFVQCRMSHAGRCEAFTPLTKRRTRRGMNAEVSAWLGCIDGLADVHARLLRMAIRSDDALAVIAQEDSEETLFYLDPPYLAVDEDGTKIRTVAEVYEHEYGLEDHVKLLASLAGLKGKFMLSGYPSKLYDRHARRHGWHCHTKEIDNKAAGGKKKRKMLECVWVNF